MPLPSVVMFGTGFIARAHARALQALAGPGETPRLAVWSPQAASRAAFCAEFPFTRAAGSAEALLAEPPGPAGIAVVATPPWLHHEQALAALRSGRHVLVEKPMALELDEASALVREAAERGLHIGDCSTRFQGMATTREAARLIREGAIGRPYHVRLLHKDRRGRPGIEYQPGSRWFQDPALSGGGPLFDWAVYDMGLLLQVFEPEAVEIRHAWMATIETGADPADLAERVESHGGASLDLVLGGGRRLPVDYERACGTHGMAQDLLEVEGTAGALRWDWTCWPGQGELVLTRDQAGQAVELRQVLAEAMPEHHHTRPLQLFLQALRDEPGGCPLDGRALFHFACAWAVREAARSGRSSRVERGLA